MIERTGHSTSLAEKLASCELDILALRVRRLRNKEIAAAWFNYPESVESPLKQIHLKLGVNRPC